MAGGSVYSLPLFLFPLVIPSGSGLSALRNGPSGLPGAALSGSRPAPAASFPSLSGVSIRPRRARYSFRPVGGCKAFSGLP